MSSSLSVNSSSDNVGCSSSCCGCCCCCCCCCFSYCSVCRNSPISSRSYCDFSSSPRLFCSSCRCRRSLFFSSLSCCMCLSCPVYYVRMLKPPIVRCFGIGFFSMMEYTLIPVLINFPPDVLFGFVSCLDVTEPLHIFIHGCLWHF